LQVFLSSKDMYRTNTAVARVQEAGRFATDFIAFDIRQAGYKGECLSEPFMQLDLDPTKYTADEASAYSTTPAIKGWDNSKPVFFGAGDSTRTNTDSFIVKYAGDGTEFTANGTNKAGDGNVGVTGETGAYSGQIVLIANSTGCDVFQNTNNQQASTFQTSGGNEKPGNTKAGMSQAYTNKLTAHVMRSHTYFIRDNAGRLPSLWRRVLSPKPVMEELVEGVIDMQVTYGIDKDGDRLADQYVKAGTNNLVANGVGDWNKVVSARISVLAISPEINVLDEPQKFVFPAIIGINRDDEYAHYGSDGTVTIKNKRVAQVYTATVAIRNRLP